MQLFEPRNQYKLIHIQLIKMHFWNVILIVHISAVATDYKSKQYYHENLNILFNPKWEVL